MTDLLAILTSLSQVLGFPAALALAWAAFVIRDHGKRISELEEESNSAKADLTKIREDVSFMRGMMEGKEGKK